MDVWQFNHEANLINLRSTLTDVRDRWNAHCTVRNILEFFLPYDLPHSVELNRGSVIPDVPPPLSKSLVSHMAPQNINAGYGDQNINQGPGVQIINHNGLLVFVPYG